MSGWRCSTCGAIYDLDRYIHPSDTGTRKPLGWGLTNVPLSEEDVSNGVYQRTQLICPSGHDTLEPR